MGRRLGSTDHRRGLMNRTVLWEAAQARMSAALPDWIIGVILACFASIISNLGINLQKLSHLQYEVAGSIKLVSTPTAPTTASALSDAQEHSSYWLRPLWVGGLFLVVLGSIADFIALAFAPQTVIAPLGSVTLIANVFFAPCLLNEKINHIEIASVCVIVVGSITSLAFAPHEDRHLQLHQLFALYTEKRFLIFAMIIILLIAAMVFLLKHYDRLRAEAIAQRHSANMFGLLDEPHEHSDSDLHNPSWTPAFAQYQSGARKFHRFLYPALSGTIGAQNVLFAKCTAELLKDSIMGGVLLFGYLPTYLVLVALGVTVFFQLKFLNDSLKLFEASYVVPVFQTFWCLGSVASGLVFFGEYVNMGARQMFAFMVGICITVSGLLLLSRRKVGASRTEVFPPDTPYAYQREKLRQRSQNPSALQLGLQKPPSRKSNLHVTIPPGGPYIHPKTPNSSDDEASPRSFLLTHKPRSPPPKSSSNGAARFSFDVL